VYNLMIGLGLSMLVGGFIANMFGSVRGSSWKIALNFVGDALMVFGTILTMMIATPKVGFEGYQRLMAGEWHTLILIGSLLIAIIGFCMNMFGSILSSGGDDHAAHGATATAPAHPPAAGGSGMGLNFTGAFLMFLGTVLMTLLLANPATAESFQKWAKEGTPMSSTTTTPPTTGTPGDIRFNTVTRELQIKTAVPSGRTYVVKVWSGVGFDSKGKLVEWVPASGAIILPSDVTPDTEVSVSHQVEGDASSVVRILDKVKLKTLPSP